METFRSIHLQKNVGFVLEAARRAPVLFLHHGAPNAVMMSADEFRRLKVAAGEAVPSDLARTRSVTQRGLPNDPLGYDTSDFISCAKQMANDALSGRNKKAVQAELARVRRRLRIRA
jgi:hypothetical protein